MLRLCLGHWRRGECLLSRAHGTGFLFQSLGQSTSSVTGDWQLVPQTLIFSEFFLQRTQPQPLIRDWFAQIMSRHVMTFECGMSALEFQWRGNLKNGYIVLRKLANLPTINLIMLFQMCFDIYLESGSLNDVQGAESFDREKLYLRVKKWVHLNYDLKDCFCTEGERSENHLVCVLRHPRLSYCTALEQEVSLMDNMVKWQVHLCLFIEVFLLSISLLLK